jgi:alpha-1,3-rhamnosyl/mannosyltransferase
LCQSLGIAERVAFLGHVPDDDLPALYQGALPFLYPSLYEGFGLPALGRLAARTMRAAPAPGSWSRFKKGAADGEGRTRSE